ncbi:uncharacterized protein LOC134722329 [Mytilus trossulus]|uniref:uncharacterized protein LOC134722329 n=1 Tax=Mytilus trossulus TaxID=6551 RepID=UPI0030073EC4
MNLLYMFIAIGSTVTVSTADSPHYNISTLFIMKTTCPENTTVYLRQQCEGLKNEQVQHFPVTSKDTHFTYQNEFCAECNYDSNIEFWSSNAVCDRPVDFNFMFNFEEIVELTMMNKCVDAIDAVDSVDRTGPVDVEAVDVEAVDVEEGSNIFCAMCKTESQVPTIDSCNLTGRWERHEETLKQKCITLPAVPYHRPYKNIFCKMCNEATQRYNGTYSIEQNCEFIDNFTKSIHFRTLFSVFLYGDDEIYDSSKQTCQENEIFDSMLGRCREIVCYPGRILINAKCVPLVPYTSNLDSHTSLNVCSIHMYRTFRQTFVINHNDYDADKTRFAFYLIYSYAGPLIIVCLIVSSSYLSDNDLYGYDRNVCFIQDHLVLICTFIVPITIICLVDLFLFISTVINIKSTPKVNTKESFMQNKIHYTVYVKLFVLTGSAWILQILDTFFPVSSFSIVVSFLNSFQGLYIFLAYNCNRRV